MRQYLFLLSWIHGSASAGGDKTGVRKQEDLYLQFSKGNKHIFAVVISMPDLGREPLMKHMDIAAKIGYAEAFHNNYTGHDTFSDIFDLTEDKRMRSVVDDKKPKVIVV